MGQNAEANKSINSLLTKFIVAILLIIVVLVITSWQGLTPCKIAISLNPQIEFCQPEQIETRPAIISVRSDIGWQDSGVSVQAGQTLYINASGSINTWGDNPRGYTPNPNGQPHNEPCPSTDNPPNCLINGELYGTLIGRIGRTGKPFRIGAESTILVTTSGNLFLAINDNESYMQDNSGEFNVSISVK
jgi:hypothetical protein